MASHSTLGLLALNLLPLVSAHGGGNAYEIDGIVHKGNWNRLKNPSSIQRGWVWASVEEVTDPYMACGPITDNPYKPHTGAPTSISPGSYHAPMKAGSVISVNYTVPDELGPDYMNEMEAVYGKAPWRWTFGHWEGPMAAYMAPCPDSGCESVDVNSPIWVKIWEAGLRSGNWTKGDWAMRDVFYGANLDIPTPKSLKPGKYLLRHEMNNLANGGQWFPNCIQLDVSGEGTKSLPSEKGMAVSFGVGDERDAYYGNDGMDGSFCKTGDDCGGSVWFYVHRGYKTTYPMAGPPVWQG